MWAVEIAKYLIPVAAGWLAVRWAFNRYKAERLWERRLTAYTDLIAALSTIDQILGIWESHEIDRDWPTSESEDDVRERYWDARRKLEEAGGVAALILPKEVLPVLLKLQKDLARARDDTGDFMTAIGNEWIACQAARTQLLVIARPDVDPQLFPVPWRRKDIKSSSKA